MYISFEHIVYRYLFFNFSYVENLESNTYALEIDIHTLIWHSKSSVRVLYIKYPFLISLRFWQQTLFLWQKDLYWLFQINSICKIIFGSVRDDNLVELESKVHWPLTVSYVIFLFVFILVLYVLFSYR